MGKGRDKRQKAKGSTTAGHGAAKTEKKTQLNEEKKGRCDRDIAQSFEALDACDGPSVCPPAEMGCHFSAAWHQDPLCLCRTCKLQHCTAVQARCGHWRRGRHRCNTGGAGQGQEAICQRGCHNERCAASRAAHLLRVAAQRRSGAQHAVLQQLHRPQQLLLHACKPCVRVASTRMRFHACHDQQMFTRAQPCE